MRASTAVGILMMLVFPVSFIGGAFIGGNGGSEDNRTLGGVMVAIGLSLGMPSAVVGYRVIRGGVSVGAVPGFLIVLAVFFVWVLMQVYSGWQPR